jgi:hypothetical protein
MMADKKIVAIVGATGAQGGGPVRAILADAQGPFTADTIRAYRATRIKRGK